MQAARSGNAPPPIEGNINFRPSPNFKNMKKYQKSKLYEGSKLNTYTENHNHIDLPIQPPLPPNSPPSDPVYIKQECDEDNLKQQTEIQPPPTNIALTGSPDEIMCRNFARGECKKGFQCLYTHRIILSQLHGLYTFCINYQNKGCKLPKCKFVHATIKETEQFYRTGSLPSHTTAHLKNRGETVQAPECGPRSAEEYDAGSSIIAPRSTQIEQQDSYKVLQVPEYGPRSAEEYDAGSSIIAPRSTQIEQQDSYKALQVPEYGPRSAEEYDAGSSIIAPRFTQIEQQDRYKALQVPEYGPRSAEEYDAASSCIFQRLTQIEQNNSYFGYDIACNEPPAKKCKGCFSNDYRQQFMIHKIESMLRDFEERQLEIEEITLKEQRLWSILSQCDLTILPGEIISALAQETCKMEQAILALIALSNSSLIDGEI